MARRAALAATCALTPLLAVGAGMADELNNFGDGSYANNPDLTNGTTGGCAQSCMSAPEPFAPPGVVVTHDRLVPGGRAPSLVLHPGLPGTPMESDAPYFQTDWSISLRGSYVESSKVSEVRVSVVPEFSLSHESRRGLLTFDASAQLDMDRGKDPRLQGFDVGLTQEFRLDPVTSATLTGDISLSQQSVNDPDVPNNVVEMPFEFDGVASAGVSRQFGNLGLEASVDGERFVQSDTRLRARMLNNEDQKFWRGGGSLRAGYAVTPILTPFVQGGAHYTMFDAAPISTGTKLDGWEYVLSAGLAADWKDVITAEISAGYSIREFDDASLMAMGSAVYGLEVTYTPDETVALGANMSTTLNPGNPDAGEMTSVTYAGTADASYMLNSWLTLRGSISGTYTKPQFGARDTIGYGGGVGADVSLTRNTSLTFDYAYDEAHMMTRPIERTHEFALGLTFSR